MATLADLGSSANPTIISVQANSPVVEPLDGPTPVDDVMDHFPPEVYHQGRDTHLYRFLQALGGDSGVGMVKKLASNSRLLFEAEGLAFQQLDSLFAGQFNVQRLKSETYSLDVTGALTPDQWDEVLLADQSYKQRVIEFFTATRRGNSPEGLRVMAQSGTGIECDLVENYQWLFDQYSDDPLGIVPRGLTNSSAEFIIIPRFLNLSDDIYDQGYSDTLNAIYSHGDPTFSNARPAVFSAAPEVSLVGYSRLALEKLNPDIERNAIDYLDRLRPVGTLATIMPDDTRFTEVPVTSQIFASSTRINVSRFITGKAGVPWPTATSQGNFFIESGTEKEAGYYYGSARDLPVIFQTIENIHAYTDGALSDPTYGTNAFFAADNGLAPFDFYRSEFVGNYDRNMTAIFPFLLSLDPNNAYDATQAFAAQNTPLVLESRSIPNSNIQPNDVLVNGTYPLSYFSLPGVDPIQYPDSFWWGSRSRFAGVDTTGSNYLSLSSGGFQTAEILEIDLGRIREVNYINLDVLAAPINITIEYDDISTPDREAVWLPVTPVDGLPFDRRVGYDADSRTSWFNGEYNFADVKGNMIHTRYLRISFFRRDDTWPTSQSNPFPWPVLAKHLRVGRYVTNWIDAQGPLLSQDTPTDLGSVTLVSPDSVTTREVRQQFVLPSDAQRGNITPNILGFGVLLQTTDQNLQTLASPEVEIQWSIWDVTNSAAPVQLRNGVENGVVTAGLSWMDWYLEGEQTSLNGAIVSDADTVYELRISSLTALTLNTVFTHIPEQLSTTVIPGTLHFTNASTSVSTSVDVRDTVTAGDWIVNSDNQGAGQACQVASLSSSAITLETAYGGSDETTATGYIVYPYSSYDETAHAFVQQGDRNLVCRVWADVADSGRDVLGNSYRHGTRRDLPAYVQDNTRSGWSCEPNPSPNAVEALYFDVRGADSDNNALLGYIDAIRIAPKTSGVQMNVYWSQQGLVGEAPQTETEWDMLLWQPVQASYTLRRSEVIQLPHQISACFVKLEFTNLNPGPFRVPTFPPLPPRQYKLFPQWVIDQFNTTSQQQEPFIQANTPIQTQALQYLTDPTYEYENDQRDQLSQLALGTVSDSQVVSAGLSSVAGAAAVDTTTAQNIFLNTPSDFQSTQLVSVNANDGILHKLVINRFDPTLFTTPIEGTPQPLANADVAFVSTVNDRLSQAYQGITQNGMRFNQTGRHSYDIEQAVFNKKAYFVGIDTVQFLRNAYTIEHDDTCIDENIRNLDGTFEENTWEEVGDTDITDGQTVYVSYSVNPTVKDEAVTLNSFIPVELSVVGGPAFNVAVFAAGNSQGDQYFQGEDYDLIFGFDANGNRTTSIMRSPLGLRLSAPIQSLIYSDAGTVVGHAVIPAPPTDDAGVVTSVGVPITSGEGIPDPGFGDGTFGGGTFGDLRKAVSDSATTPSVGEPSGTDTYTP